MANYATSLLQFTGSPEIALDVEVLRDLEGELVLRIMTAWDAPRAFLDHLRSQGVRVVGVVEG